MHTVAETDVFIRYASAIWNDEERAALVQWLAQNPHAGAVIPGSGGCRKVRFARGGMGKRGGARVIYFNRADGQIWLLIAYAKAKFDNLPAAFLARLKNEVEHGQGNATIHG